MKKLIGISSLIIILSTFFLAVFQVFSWNYFWVIAALIAIIAWWVLPRLKD